jgi:hypothetical protein
MTNYNLKPIILLSLAARDAKAARTKLLAAVRKRRTRIAKTRHQRQQQAYEQREEYKEYQDQLREKANLTP